jgi:Xaa-Pro aminopeptidase
METMQPTLKCGRNTWDRINMPGEEFYARVKKMRKKMKEEGIDLLLLYGHAYNDYGNYCYFSNYVIRLPQGAIVTVPARGELTLMFEGASRGVPSVKKLTWLTDVRACGDVGKECITYIKEKNFTSQRIGVVGMKRLMPQHQWQLFRDSLPNVKIIDADSLLQEMRTVKSTLEIMQIRRSTRIIRDTFDFLTRASFAEPNAKLLEAALRREARLEGAEDFRMMIAYPSDKKWAFMPPEGRPIAAGDTVIINLSVEFERYWAEAVRTFSFRESRFTESRPELMNKLAADIRGCLQSGKSTSQFTKEAMEKIASSKQEYIPEYGLGMGIGLSPHEYPMLAQSDHTVLGAGMAFSFRLGFSDKALGAIMDGDTLLLSKKGYEILTR